MVVNQTLPGPAQGTAVISKNVQTAWSLLFELESWGTLGSIERFVHFHNLLCGNASENFQVFHVQPRELVPRCHKPGKLRWKSPIASGRSPSLAWCKGTDLKHLFLSLCSLKTICMCAAILSRFLGSSGCSHNSSSFFFDSPSSARFLRRDHLSVTQAQSQRSC